MKNSFKTKVMCASKYNEYRGVFLCFVVFMLNCKMFMPLVGSVVYLLSPI